MGAGLALCRASGWNQTEADWKALLEPPSVFRAAELDARVVGTAGAVAYGRELAWVCMVLVDPAFRGRGLGSRLVSEVLERLSGFEIVGLDATPQGRPVYARLGFAEGYGLARMEGPADAGRAAAATTHAARPGVRPFRDEDLRLILPWDAQAFSADRSRVLRFAQTSAPEYAWVFEEGGRLDGYCFGRHGQNAEQIGPVVARGPEVARALVEAVRARHPERRFFMDVATDEPWKTMVVGLGFREQRPFTRMYRGGAAPLAPPPGLHAVLGPEFG